MQRVHGWDGAGAITPINRYATMFSGVGINNVDGTEWYFPQRLTDDTAAVDNGNANPAQGVLDVEGDDGHELPKSLLIYAFGAALGGQRCSTAAQALATQSHIPMRNLTLVNRQSTYAHNDPAGAYPAQRVLRSPGAVPEQGRRSRVVALTRVSGALLWSSVWGPDGRGLKSCLRD